VLDRTNDPPSNSAPISPIAYRSDIAFVTFIEWLSATQGTCLRIGVARARLRRAGAAGACS
jgi:hypothetical protein